MRFNVNGSEVYASTGGRDHQKDQRCLVFLHGAGSSHLLWTQQVRSFAYAGNNVLALDFPGHNLSGGEMLPDVESQADWVIAVLDELGVNKFTAIGHSQGGLVCIELASRYPDRVDKAVFVATAAAIPVNDALISTAEKKEPNAKAAMTAWGHGPDAHHFDNTVPGFSHLGMNLRIMDLNLTGAVANDLKACAAYEGGLEKAATVNCPTMCVLAGKDRMTPVKFGLKLAEALPNNILHVLEGSGHTIPGEYPHELNQYLRDFLNN